MSSHKTGNEAGQFDHERLQVFQVARECAVLVTPWLAGRKMPTSLRDQFDRAITSILSNIAEGAGKTARADKRRSYEIAKGSTTEAAAQLELLHLREVISAAEYAKARHLLLRVASMLHVLSSGPRTA